VKDLPHQLVTEAIEAHQELLARFKADAAETIGAAARMITQAVEAGRTVYICGNGGSAADAQHIAGELVGRFRRERKALPAIALSTDTSVLTCIANDYDFTNVFARQVDALVGDGDVLWALSTSGNSPNIISAVKRAREKGAQVLAFTGKPGSQLERLADICFCAASESTARSQEVHQLAYHIVCDLVEQSFAGD